MVVTGDYQCNVCNSITRIRVQLGWLENYPVRIKCGKCNISIFGNVYLDQQNAGYSIKLKNVTHLEDIGNPEYLIEVSGELLTEKMDHILKMKILFSLRFLKMVYFLWEKILENLNKVQCTFYIKLKMTGLL